MIFIDLDGNEYKTNLTKNSINRASTRQNKSSLHLTARELIYKTFSVYNILEEIPIQILPKEFLYLDFFIPLKYVAIEINGEQHYKYIHHFHGSQINFLKQKKRDGDKREWCKINSITLIELKWDNIDNWGEILGKY